MKRLFLLVLSLASFHSYGQSTIRPVEDLINEKESAWNQILEWQRAATNTVTILPRELSQAREALFYTQVTTKSPMGAIIYESGGILIDNGWIRILGSGSTTFRRSLPAWNKGKSFSEYGERPGFLLIADDAVGGFFAINGGGLDTNKVGMVFYLSPDSLAWECLNVGYTQFINFCFCGDVGLFYQGLRWTTWKVDLQQLSADEVYTFYPFLFTKEGKDIEKNNKKKVSVDQAWQFYCSLKAQGM